jgi:hypothetical protein
LGIGGCVSGNQSGGLNASRVCAGVSDSALPGIVRGSGLAGAGLAHGVDGGLTVYAHGGGTGDCARAVMPTTAATMAIERIRLMRR